MKVLISNYTNYSSLVSRLKAKIINLFTGADRIEHVKIDKFDAYSADSTLALIILPLLKEVREGKHGAPFVDNEDVPEHLHGDGNLHETDDNWFERHDYILDEMIWTFEQLQPEVCVHDMFGTGEVDFVSEPIKWDEHGEPTLYEMKHGPNHTYEFDNEGYKEYDKRIVNGLRLFGKYFRTLWT